MAAYLSIDRNCHSEAVKFKPIILSVFRRSENLLTGDSTPYMYHTCRHHITFQEFTLFLQSFSWQHPNYKTFLSLQKLTPQGINTETFRSKLNLFSYSSLRQDRVIFSEEAGPASAPSPTDVWWHVNSSEFHAAQARG